MGRARVTINDDSIEHYFSFDVGTGAVDLRVGLTTTGAEILTDTSYSVGSNSYSYNPTSGTTTIFVQFKHAVDATHTIDNVVMDTELAGSAATDYWAEGSWSDENGWPRTVGCMNKELVLFLLKKTLLRCGFQSQEILRIIKPDLMMMML